MWEEAKGEGSSLKFIGKSSYEWVFFITAIKDLPALLKSLDPISAESLRDWAIPRVSELQSLVSGRWQGRYSTGYSKATHWWRGVHVSGHPILTIPSLLPIFCHGGCGIIIVLCHPCSAGAWTVWVKGTRKWHIKSVGLSLSTPSYKAKEQPVTYKLELTRFPLPHLD